jgi:hypothetical protein
MKVLLELDLKRKLTADQLRRLSERAKAAGRSVEELILSDIEEGLRRSEKDEVKGDVAA